MNDDSFLELRDQLRLGSERAAREVFRRFAHRLIGLARKHLSERLRSKVDPEDVAQSALKSFFLGGALDGDYEGWDDVWAMLLVITARKCARKAARYRAARRDVARERGARGRDAPAVDWAFISGEPTPAQAVALADVVEKLMASLDIRVGRPTAQLLLQGYTAVEIAAELGVSERTVQRYVKLIREKTVALLDLG